MNDHREGARPPFLTLDEISRHLRRISYRPGWRFDVYVGRYEGISFSIHAELPDSTLPGELVTIRVDSRLPPFDTIEQFEAWLLWRLIIVESHECREWLKRDGAPIADPHAPYASRDL